MSLDALLSDHPAYPKLQAKARSLETQSIATMLQQDSARVDDFALQAAGLRLDFSKQLVDRECLDLLMQLAAQTELEQRIAQLFAGEHLNITEQRPALHMLLRANSHGPHGALYAEVDATRARIQRLADDFNQGNKLGFSGKPISDVVNIGIGGSDLGPRLVSEALQPFGGNVRCHYVANVDPADLAGTVADLDPQATLFIICSKSFRTEETLANSLSARQWLLDNGAQQQDLDKHFLAVTTNLEAAENFGIPRENCLPMWDWVGGRYSVWSAVGLSSAIAVGWDNFEQFLGGARAMDEHFQSSDYAHNMPLIMALLEIWNCNFLGARNHAVLPYDHSLRQLSNYLQQLTMESNGKGVALDGRPLAYQTAPVLWGSPGTIGQHSFHQLLHQGTQLCPVDFVLAMNTLTDEEELHRRLVANCFAQSRTLLLGRSIEDATNALLSRGVEDNEAARLAPHLAMPGNRPNTMITMDSLTPENLGALLALYEHRTFCSGQLWHINSFDQWGVEVGKEIGVQILDRLSGTGDTPMDAATERLMQVWRDAQNNHKDTAKT